MKAVIGSAMKYVFALFAVVVFGILMSYTFSALGRVYPNDLLKQGMGLVLFDVGALVWFGVFLFESKGLKQRAVALLMFGLCVVCTLGIVLLEVMLGGQTYITVAPWVGQSLIYVYMAAVVFNVLSVYAFHITAPELLDAIEDQSAADALLDEAREQAAENVKVEKAGIVAVLARRLDVSLKSRLKLPLAADLFNGPVEVVDPPDQPHPTV